MQNFVLDAATNQVLRHGYVDFTNESCFDSNTETMITARNTIDIWIMEQSWYWNADTQEFQTTQP